MHNFDKLFDQKRSNITKEFDTKHRQMLEMSKFLNQAIHKYRDLGWNTHAQIWNIALYLNIAAHDISILVLQVSAEQEVWNRKLAARHLALAAYETVEDMRQLLGQPIRQSLEKLGLLAVLDSALRKAREPLDSYWENYSQSLKSIRVDAVAHRFHDGVSLFERIDLIDVEKMLELGLRLGNVQNQLGEHIQKILDETSRIPPPEFI